MYIYRISINIVLSSTSRTVLLTVLVFNQRPLHQ